MSEGRRTQARRTERRQWRIAPIGWFAIITLLAGGVFAMFAALLHHRGAVFNSDDPVGYYVYLRSLVHDGDLDFTNDYAFFRRPDGSPGANLDRIDPITGRPDNNYTVGTPLLAAPIYTLGRVLFASSYANRGSAQGFPLFLDQLLFSYAGLVLGFFGMWLSFKFASCYFAERESLIATVAFWLGSPLLYYLAREPFQSHLAAVFAVSLFLYLWQAPFLSTGARPLLMGIAAALVMMVRQQDLVVVVIPVGAALLTRRGARPWSWRAALAMSALFTSGFVAAFAVQMCAWYQLRGSWLTFAYRGETFPHLWSPNVLAVLFSSNHGLIVWHPLIALCLLGLALLGPSTGAVGWLGLLCFSLQLYAIGSWWSWWMGHSFGHRGFLGLTPLFGLGLTAVVARLTRPWQRRLFVVVMVGLFAWNVTLMTAYLSEMIPYEGEFSWYAFITALPDLLSHVLTKLKHL